MVTDWTNEQTINWLIDWLLIDYFYLPGAASFENPRRRRFHSRKGHALSSGVWKEERLESVAVLWISVLKEVLTETENYNNLGRYFFIGYDNMVLQIHAYCSGLHGVD